MPTLPIHYDSFTWRVKVAISECTKALSCSIMWHSNSASFYFAITVQVDSTAFISLSLSAEMQRPRQGRVIFWNLEWVCYSFPRFFSASYLMRAFTF